MPLLMNHLHRKLSGTARLARHAGGEYALLDYHVALTVNFQDWDQAYKLLMHGNEQIWQK